MGHVRKLWPCRFRAASTTIFKAGWGHPGSFRLSFSIPRRGVDLLAQRFGISPPQKQKPSRLIAQTEGELARAVMADSRRLTGITPWSARMTEINLALEFTITRANLRHLSKSCKQKEFDNSKDVI
jgi:hypothetical protein